MAPPTSTRSNEEDAAMESEWQDVADASPERSKLDHESAGEESYLGRELAKTAIDKISEHRITVTTPLSAIALVIHASLRSLGFACTGIPEASTSAFAAPVRELRESQFMPQRWDNDRQLIQLRYRKDGTGALKLMVALEKSENDMVKIQFVAANSQEPPSQTLTFAMKEHINMDSWKAATSKTKKIAPALHFKFLPVLLTKFCQMYDLGSTSPDGEAPRSIPYMDNTITTSKMQAQFTPSSTIPTPPSVPVAASRPWQNGHVVPSILDQAFPQVAVANRGHFAGDLAPAGLLDPLRIGGGHVGGNLMGPNHPHFTGGNHPHFTGGMGPGFPNGPGSMQPRFDPVHPPCLDIGVDGQPRRNRPSRSGEPNPDHLRPPNSFAGDNMFT